LEQAAAAKRRKEAFLPCYHSLLPSQCFHIIKISLLQATATTKLKIMYIVYQASTKAAQESGGRQAKWHDMETR